MKIFKGKYVNMICYNIALLFKYYTETLKYFGFNTTSKYILLIYQLDYRKCIMYYFDAVKKYYNTYSNYNITYYIVDSVDLRR